MKEPWGVKMHIETKYSVGDVVYAPEVTHEKEWEPCPDCLGQRKWLAVLPTGEVEFMACPTCRWEYRSRGEVEEYEHGGRVVVLTIGSIQFDSNEESCHSTTRYMCEETGVGSGRIWDEDRLHRTREEAEALLPGMVEARRVEWDEQRAASTARSRKDHLGSMVSHYRRQIRQAQRDIEAAERGLAREAAKGAT